MPFLIEFIGPSGVGKTSIRAEVQRRIAGSTLISTDRLVLNYDSRLARIRRRIGRCLKGKDSLERDRAFASEFGAKYPVFIIAYWHGVLDSVKDSSGVYNAYSRLGEAIKVFARIERLAQSKSHKCIIVDEGILHWMYDAIGSNKVDSDSVDWLLSNVPLPDGYIYCMCDPEVITQRLLKRLDANDLVWDADMMRRKQRHTVETMRVRALVHACLKKRGVPYLEINTERSITENAERIIKFAYSGVGV